LYHTLWTCKEGCYQWPSSWRSIWQAGDSLKEWAIFQVKRRRATSYCTQTCSNACVGKEVSQILWKTWEGPGWVAEEHWAK
jgi:hypothetical protein